MKFNADNGYWILPSRRRPTQLRDFFAAYEKTKATTRFLVLVDKTDFELWSGDILSRIIPAEIDFVCLPDESCDCQGNKFRWLQNSEYWKTSQWFGWMTDDQIPETDLWDVKTLEHLTDDTFISGNDKWQPNRLVGAAAFSKKLLDCFGGFYVNDFKHSWADQVFEEIGRDTGCWKRLADVYVLHNHHAKGESEYDSTYQCNDSFLAHDQMEWKKWLINDYARVKRNVMKLQGKLE